MTYRKLAVVAWILAASFFTAVTVSTSAELGAAGVHQIRKEVFIPMRNDTSVFPGFVTYVHASKPILLHRSGWVNASDTYGEQDATAWRKANYYRYRIPLEAVR
jgi:hypothetical protein